MVDDEKMHNEVKLFNRWRFNEVQVEIVLFFSVFDWKYCNQSCFICHLVRSVGDYEFWISNLLLEILVLILCIRNGFSRLYYFRFTLIFELVHWHCVNKITLGQCVERVIRLLFL